MQFNVGDVVILKEDNKDGRLLKLSTGVVASLAYYPEELGIFWDGFTEGHDCGVKGSIEQSGWFVYSHTVELIDEENE